MHQEKISRMASRGKYRIRCITCWLPKEHSQGTTRWVATSICGNPPRRSCSEASFTTARYASGSTGTQLSEPRPKEVWTAALPRAPLASHLGDELDEGSRR